MASEIYALSGSLPIETLLIQPVYMGIGQIFKLRCKKLLHNYIANMVFNDEDPKYGSHPQKMNYCRLEIKWPTLHLAMSLP